MYSEIMLKGWVKDHTLRAPSMGNAPAFYRNIEQALDTLRADYKLSTAKPRWDHTVVDWASSDFLSLNRTGRIREAFLEELSKHKDWDLSAAGSRLQYGNYDYILEVEKEIAEFFGSETAFIGHSGFLCNLGIVASIALPGDCFVYDELVHASTHDGMKLSRATHKVSFQHNDVDSLRDTLISLRDTYPEFRLGTKNILIPVESIYSMNGDVCPLKEFVEIAKEIFPLGNAQFIVDEAHCIGVLGSNGRGLVSMLGLEEEIAIRVHMCSKAMASTGGMILCKKSMRAVIMHFVRFAVYSGAPSFPMVASIRAGIQLLRSGATQTEQLQIQKIVCYFFEKLTANSVWSEAVDKGLLSCPLSEGWDQRQYQSHIVPIRTRTRHEQYLFFHLLAAGMNAYHFAYPVVPKGKSRIRMVFHAHNTEEEVNRTVNAICDWAREMLDMEERGLDTVPTVARKVFAMQVDNEVEVRA